MEGYGAGGVYVTDSGGRLTIAAYASAMRPTGGFCGANRVDASLTGMGTGAGNCHIKAFIGVADLHGWTHGCDLFKQQDAAEELMRPPQDRHVRVDRETLMLGYAGVYSSFPRQAEEATELHGLDTRDILVELDRRKMVDTRRT